MSAFWLVLLKELYGAIQALQTRLLEMDYQLTKDTLSFLTMAEPVSVPQEKLTPALMAVRSEPSNLPEKFYHRLSGKRPLRQ